MTGAGREKLVLAPFSFDFIDRLVSWPQTASELQWWSGLTGVEETDRRLLQEWQTEVDSDAYLLMEGDLPVAYGELWNEPGEAELAHLMVDPARQGQRLGVRLVRELSALAAKDPATDVFLRVQPDNAVAIKCYLRAGYERMSPEEETRFNAGQPRSYTWMRPG